MTRELRILSHAHLDFAADRACQLGQHFGVAPAPGVRHEVDHAQAADGVAAIQHQGGAGIGTQAQHLRVELRVEARIARGVRRRLGFGCVVFAQDGVLRKRSNAAKGEVALAAFSA